MPGIYAKPPKRAAFAKEINYMILVLKKKETERKWSEIMEVCVPMILDEFALERQKAREEARRDFEEQVLEKCGEALPRDGSPTKHDNAENADINAVRRESNAAGNQKSTNSKRDDGATSGAADSATQTVHCQRRALSLAELEARKERDVAEVFFVEGVHSAFCKILQMSSKEPQIGDVMPIVMEYERLLLVEIDPYDIDIGPLPLLIYFLSERHHFYVDIHWQHHELTIMETFLCSLTSVLEAVKSGPAECAAKKSISVNSARNYSDSSTIHLGCTQGLATPNSAPSSTPAASAFSLEKQFVAPSAAKANDDKTQFSPVTSKPTPGAHLTAAENDSISEPRNDASAEQSENTYAAVLKLLYRTLFTFPPHRVVSRMATVFDAARCRTLTRAILCTSAFWESSKGLAQVARTLAAVALFGLGAPVAAAVVPASLLWVGASNLIRETRCPCSSCELQRRLLKACRMRDEVGVQEAAQDKRQIAYCLVRAGAPRLLQQLFLSLAQQQLRALKGTTNTSVDGIEKDHISYTDQALQFSSWVLLLCSWPYEEMHVRESLLAFDTTALLDSILACFPTTHRRFLTSLTAHQRPGATSLLSATLHLLLRARLASRGRLLLRTNAVFYPLLIHIATFIAKRDPYSRARDMDALLSDMSEGGQDSVKASAAAGDEEIHSISPHQKVELKGKAAVSVTSPVKAKHEGSPTPKVDVLLWAPVVMGLFQSLLCNVNQPPFEPSTETLGGATTSSDIVKVTDPDVGAPSSTVNEIASERGAAIASVSVSNIRVIHKSASPAPSCASTVSIAQQSASPAGLAAGAPMTTGHLPARIPQQPDCPPTVKDRLSNEAVEELSRGPTATGALAETSTSRSVSIAPEQRRLVSLGTAACQAFVHLYEYLRPLLPMWQGLESRQDFQYCQSEHTSNVSGQTSACEEDPVEQIGKSRARESAASPSSLGVATMGSSRSSANTPFLPSRVCLAPCLNTTAAGFDYRAFYYAVVSCMLTLVGGMRLQALPQNRWRFAENPAAGAGGTAAIGVLASAARKIIDFQKRELTEVCTYVKNAANLVIMRAEQASAISLRYQTTP